MSGGSGLIRVRTAAAELRQEDVKVPIIAMTAAAFTGYRDKCLAAGCDAYLSKLIDPANFIHQISNYLV
jgi:CheY-like chemotaxis protein